MSPPRRVLLNLCIFVSIVLLTLTAYTTILHHPLYTKPRREQAIFPQWKRDLDRKCSTSRISANAVWPNMTISKPALSGKGPYFCGPLDRCLPADPPVIWIG